MSTSNGAGKEWVPAPLPPPELTEEAMKKVIPLLLSALPAEDRGTTFRNSALLGREEYAARLLVLMTKGLSSGAITLDDMNELGVAEDYLRVASNVSTIWETVLSVGAGHGDVARVISFSSEVMPLIAVLLSARLKADDRRDVIVFFDHSTGAPPVLPEGMKALGADYKAVSGNPSDFEAQGAMTIRWKGTGRETDVDAVVATGGVLFIQNPAVVIPSDIILIRKRMSTPITTPRALLSLEAYSKGESIHEEEIKADDKHAVEAHLQEMSGTPVDNEAPPPIFTAGLSAINAFFQSLLERGGADVLMCSTAYGGSSQLLDINEEASGSLLRKHTFDIQGDKDLSESVPNALKALSEHNKEALLPTTVLFVEMPTNPDMKMIDAASLSTALMSYKKDTARDVFLLIDTTFAPASHTLSLIKEAASDLPAATFISLSKSVSRGTTTAGALVANHTDFSTKLIAAAAHAGLLLCTRASTDQWKALIENHNGVETRCKRAYGNAKKAVDAVRRAVVEVQTAGLSEGSLRVAFVSDDSAAKGFHTSTFSVNLPRPLQSEAALLAQRFVDALTADPLRFKPCVSFGQDNGLVYCTVPATSTQGAIPEHHKAKQAIGGVQLVRLSFPPTMDVEAVTNHIVGAVKEVYYRSD